jgi:ubiquinone/menaquinone biosynthesis C-methylase UbiE
MTEAPFHQTAELYDLVYSHLDYAGHAATVEGIIRERHPEATSLLDVACGTGKHLAIWRGRFDRVVGLDLDEALLEVAAERIPDVPLHHGDYTDFDLGETFDAVTCLFSSIGYARTPERLDAAVASMARHLTAGGVLIIEPWYRKEMLVPPWVRLHTVERDDVVLARSSVMKVGDVESDMEMNYLVTTAEGTERFTERHVMGLFTPDQFERGFTAAGLVFEWDPEGTYLGRGLAVGVRPN